MYDQVWCLYMEKHSVLRMRVWCFRMEKHTVRRMRVCMIRFGFSHGKAYSIQDEGMYDQVELFVWKEKRKGTVYEIINNAMASFMYIERHPITIFIVRWRSRKARDIIVTHFIPNFSGRTKKQLGNSG